VRRLILGLAAFAFLGLVGAQSFHAHEAAADKNCSVCVVTRQSARVAPAAGPALDVDLLSQAVWPFKPICAAVTLPSVARARAPPAA
jgi:hypothetical protein